MRLVWGIHFLGSLLRVFPERLVPKRFSFGYALFESNLFENVYIRAVKMDLASIISFTITADLDTRDIELKININSLMSYLQCFRTDTISAMYENQMYRRCWTLPVYKHLGCLPHCIALNRCPLMERTFMHSSSFVYSLLSAVPSISTPAWSSCIKNFSFENFCFF